MKSEGDKKAISISDDTGLQELDVILLTKRLEMALMDTPAELGRFVQAPAQNGTLNFESSSSLITRYNHGLNGDSKDDVGQYVLFPELFGSEVVPFSRTMTATYRVRVLPGQIIELDVYAPMLPADDYKGLSERDLASMRHDLETLKEAHLILDGVLRRFADSNKLHYKSPFHYDNGK